MGFWVAVAALLDSTGRERVRGGCSGTVAAASSECEGQSGEVAAGVGRMLTEGSVETGWDEE